MAYLRVARMLSPLSPSHSKATQSAASFRCKIDKKSKNILLIILENYF